MRKLFFLLFLLAGVGFVFAQDSDESPKVRVSVRVGGVGSLYVSPKGTSIGLNPSDEYATNSMKIGVTAGVAVNVPLTPKLFLQTGLMYSLQRNGEHGFATYLVNDTNMSVDATIKYKSHHLRLPLMLMYHHTTNPNHFCAGAGFFADVAMGGRLNYSSSARLTPGDSYIFEGDFDPFSPGNKYLNYHIASDEYTQKYLLGNGPFFKRFNFGVSAEIGYQISKVYLGAHLDFGIINMARPEMCGELYKQRPLDVMVLIGYNIN